MKNKSKLPDPPVLLQDVPGSPPAIAQAELVVAADAEHRFRIARADYERKRAALTLKLLQGCQAEPGSIEVKLDEEGNVVLTDWTSSGPADVVKLVSA